jgi:hypothetical protein
MKSNELKEIIKSLVKEELEKTLPVLIPKILTEALIGKQVNEPTINSKPIVNESVQKSKEIKKYTNNPVLNEILNQTIVKIPKEDSLAGIDSQFKSQALSGLQVNESVQSENEKITPVNEEQGKVLNVINRDFRSLLKAVDKKRQIGNLNTGLVSTQ